VVTDLESDSEVEDVEPAGELVVPEVVARHLGRQAPLLVSEPRPSTALVLFKPLAGPPTAASTSAEQRLSTVEDRKEESSTAGGNDDVMDVD
jgi:hypothetical protein